MKPGVIFIILSMLVLLSCQSPQLTDLEKEIAAIMDTDLAFSDMSAEKGMKASFLAYMDSGAVLLRPEHYPIIGKKAIDYLQQQNDSSFTLTWKPSAADVSASGDLGFTYGLYLLTLPDTSFEGTYVSIWKKQEDGTWKFVLDSGNQGLGRK